MQLAIKQKDADGFFSPRLRAMVAGVASVVAVAGMGASQGCSPQDNSYWSGTFTALPDPPKDSRIQIGVSTEDDGKLFINYVVWDKESELFMRKDIHYTTTALHPGTFSEAGGYKQKILDGEVLASGAIVDQKAGKIILPGGTILDGKTGNTLNAKGVVIKTLDKD